MEGNTEAPQEVAAPQSPPAEAPNKAAFSPITVQESPATPSSGPEKGFLMRIAEKFGMLKQPEAPIQPSEAVPTRSGLAVESNAVDAFTTNGTNEELQALNQTRAALEAETQAQKPTAPATSVPPVSPAVQRMESGQGVGKSFS